MKTFSSAFCAICAAVCLAAPASAASETIAYWPFGTNGFHDVSGNGHDLVGVEIAESDAAYVSLNPDSTTNQYLKTATALDLSGETAVTFECWCRQTAHPAGTYNVALASANPTAGTGGFVIYNSGSIYQAQMRAATDGWQIDYSFTNDGVNVSQALAGNYVDGAWHHIAYVVDRSRGNDQNSCRLYLDGFLQRNGGKTGSATYTVPQLFNDFFVIGGGADYVAGQDYFRGYIDDVRISRGALTPEDFLKCPTVGKAMRADDGKLPVVAYWPFGGKRGKDVTGNGFDLVTSNVLFKSGYANTTWATRANPFACSPDGNFPFSAFSKTGLTIEMFVKGDSSSKYLGMIMETGPAYWNNPGAFRISYDANDNGYTTLFSGYHVSGSAGAYSRTTEETMGDLGDGTWRHLAMVYDPAKRGAGIITLYVDGVPATCSTESVNTDQGAFALGDLPLYLFRRANKQVGDESVACPFYGSLDDVRITGAALTPDKFQASRSANSIVALYRFDQGTTEDVSGNGCSLTFEGGTPVIEDTPRSSFSGCYYYGLKMDGALRFHTTAPIDLAGAKAMTVEFDYNRYWNGDLYAMAASEDVALAGGFTFYRTGTSLQAQCRLENNASWAFVQSLTKSGNATSTGFYGGRFSYDVNESPASFNLNVDGTNKSTAPTVTVGNLVNQKMYFGGCPTYPNSDDSQNKRFKGYFYRIAISDVKLEPEDYVLDNLIDPEAKRTLAYWNCANFDGLTASGVRRINGALSFDGTASATTTNLTLSALAQATIECFVCFGETPSSGTVLSLGSGVGSFAIASDAAAGTLAGTFIPYNHLATSNGGAAALAPLAGKGAWHHVALVIDRTKPGADAVRFYVDYERAMPAGRAWDKAAAMLDGSISIGTGFTGRIDDLRVSAGALEPSEFIPAAARTEVPGGTCLIVR